MATSLMSRCAFVGVEHRNDLVATAGVLAEVFGVQDRVAFIEGTFGHTPLPDAECYYFYNPFLEAMLGPQDWLDDRVEHGECRYDREILAVEHWLSHAIGRQRPCSFSTTGRETFVSSGTWWKPSVC